MWYSDNHTRCENLHTLEGLQERGFLQALQNVGRQVAKDGAKGWGKACHFFVRMGARRCPQPILGYPKQWGRAGTRPKEGWALAQEPKTYANGADAEKDQQDERTGGVFGDL